MDLFIQSLVLFSLTTGAVAWLGKQAGEIFLRDAEKQLLRNKFEIWWIRVADLPPRKLASEIIRKIDKGFEAYLGPKPFSKRSFKRCGVVSLSLLSCTLFFLGIFSKNHSVITPWKNYHDSMVILKSHHNSELQTEKTAQYRELEEKIRSAAERLDTPAMAVIFSVCFYALLVVTNAVGFFFTTAFLRRLLKALSNIEDLLVSFSLFLLTAILTAVVTTFCVFAMGVVGNPTLWMVPIAALFLAATSFKMALLVVVAVATTTWLFASPSSLALAFAIFLPLVLAMLIIGFTFLALLKPKLFHWLVARILILCAEKEPITIIAAMLAFVSASITWIINMMR